MDGEGTRLSLLKIGSSAEIISLEATGRDRRRLNELGFAKGERVVCVGASPFGDPRAYLVRGAIIALRQRDSSKIEMSNQN